MVGFLFAGGAVLTDQAQPSNGQKRKTQPPEIGDDFANDRLRDVSHCKSHRSRAGQTDRRSRLMPASALQRGVYFNP
jgi:hypothetical protein